MISKDNAPNLFGIAIVAAVILAILILRIVAIADGRAPDHDQSMILANFPLASMAGYFDPLPLYQQTSTLGHVVLLDQVSHWLGNVGMDRVHMIRSIGAAFGLAGLALLALTLLRVLPPLAVALIILLGGTSDVMQWSSTDTKQYIFGGFNACLMLWLGVRYLEAQTTLRGALFALAALFTSLMSFTAAIIVAMVGGALLIHMLREVAVGRQGMQDIARLAVVGVFASLPPILFYVFYTRDVTAVDFAVYAVRDARSYLTLDGVISDWNRVRLETFVGFLSSFVRPPLILSGDEMDRAFALFFCAVTVIGWVALLRRSLFLGAAAVLGPLTVLTLNLWQLVPFSSARQFIFLMPVIVPSFGFGLYLIVKTAADWLSLGPPLRIGASVAGLAALSLFAFIRATDLEARVVEPHFDRIAADPAPVYLYYGGQPLIDALNPDLPETFGRIPVDGTNAAWVAPVRNEGLSRTLPEHIEEVGAQLEGRDRAWLLFIHHWPERNAGGLGPWIEMAEAAIGPCHRFAEKGAILFDCRREGLSTPPLDQQGARATHLSLPDEGSPR